MNIEGVSALNDLVGAVLPYAVAAWSVSAVVLLALVVIDWIKGFGFAVSLGSSAMRQVRRSFHIDK